MAPPYVPLQDGNWGTWIQQIGFGPDDHIFAGTFDPLRASLEVHAEINLEDADTAPGLQASSSDPLALRYVVINTGQQALHGVLVTDDQLGVITCPTNQLDVGADMICDVPLSNPSDGQHTNNATVTATAADGTPVSASNPVNYATLNVLVGKRCTAHDGTGCPEPLQDAPDPSTHGTVTSSFDVVGCGTIDNVKVGLSINHTYVGDLLITLTSPNNTTVTLVNSPVNGNDDCPFDNLRALLDDGSANGNVDGQCAATTPAIFGVFQPSQPLAAFNGGTGNGTWTLTVNDVYPADTGTLNDWSLQLTCH
jgi:subtilisin-like proprotein convertase family protein